MKTVILALALLFAAHGMASAETFHGYECVDDCAGHQAGYDWAEENGIVDENECYTESQSFTEGCRAYVEENKD